METLSSISFKPENTKPLEEKTGASQCREKEDFFQWNILKVYKSSAESNPHYETVWHLFGPKQPVENYRNEVFGWVSHGISNDYAMVLSAEHTELNKVREDYLERDDYYAFATRDKQNLSFKLFLQLAATWKYETQFASSLSEIVMNSSYLQIIGMGMPAIPFIMRSLVAEPNHWFSALQAITRENPILPEDRGDIPAMAGAWLSWGKDKGYL